MDYDTWKLMTPEEDSNIQYCDIEADVGVWVTPDEYKELIINLEVPVEEDWDDDRGKILAPINMREAIDEYMYEEYPDCEYDLFDWRFV